MPDINFLREAQDALRILGEICEIEEKKSILEEEATKLRDELHEKFGANRGLRGYIDREMRCWPEELL